jgi:Spy/CpxP family protein refolding chaperone
MKTQGKNKKKVLGVVAAFSAVFLVAGVAIARPGGFFTKDPARADRYATFFVDDVLDELDARDDQRKEVHALKDRVLKQALATRSEKEQVRSEFAAILASDNPSSERVHAIVDEQSTKMTALAHEMADAALELHAILDAEQRTELLEHMEKRRGAHGRHGWR